MDILLFIFYYIIYISSVIFYISFRNKNTFSISDAIMIVTYIVITLGGYFNANGVLLDIDELNIRLYIDYILFMILLPTGLILGNKIKLSSYITNVLDNKILVHRLLLVISFIVIISVFYFYFIRNNIPLLQLISGSITDIGQLNLNRLSITHNFEGNYKIPFFLKYYQLILHDVMKLILGIVFLLFLKNKKKYKYAFIVVLLVTLFFHSYNLEKSGVIYIILLLFIAYVHFYNISIKDNIFKYFNFGLIVFFTLILSYMIFMGVENFFDATSNMLQRAVLGQTGMVYLQDAVLEMSYGGSLWGQGVPIFFLDSFIGREIVNLSTEVYSSVFSVYANSGGIGTTGGMPFFYLRSNFGYLLGSIVLLIISLITGMLDTALLKGIKNNQNKILIISLYSTILIYSVQGFMSNFTKLYMLPLGVSPSIAIILATAVFLIIRKSK